MKWLVSFTTPHAGCCPYAKTNDVAHSAVVIAVVFMAGVAMQRVRTKRHRPTSTASLLVLCCVALVAGCELPTPVDADSTEAYYTITRDFKDSTSYPAGTSLSIPLHLTHDGAAIYAASVQWAILSGSGRISDTVTATDTLGATRIVWTLGNTPELNALIVGFGDAVDTLYAIGVVGAPSSLSVVGAQSVALASGSPANLQVVVKDRPGNVAANTSVVWSTTGGQLSAVNTVSDTTGVATTAFSANTPGTYYVTADLPDVATCIFEIIVR